MIELTYDPRSNVACLRLQERSLEVETIRVSDELNVDIAPDGTVYGIELLNANDQLHAGDDGALERGPRGPAGNSAGHIADAQARPPDGERTASIAPLTTDERPSAMTALRMRSGPVWIRWMDDQLERAAVTKAHRREVPHVARGQATNAESLGKRDDRSIHQPEAKI